MNAKLGIVLLVIAAAIAIATAIAHISCIYFGPKCYAVQMAPASVVKSAEKGTLLAPIGTLIVSAVFVVFGCYALSGAKVIRRLPLLSFGVYAIAFACIIRGLLPLQLWVRHPNKVTETVIIVGVVWLLVGLCYLLGYRAVNGKRRITTQ